MNRRDLLIGAAAGCLAQAVSTALFPGHALQARFAKGWASAPDRGYPRRPMTLIAGAAPDDLVGTYFLNGPAKHERGGFRYRHWFDGDGMIHAVRFGAGDAAPTHEGRFVETRKFRAEREAGRFVMPAFGTIPPDPRLGTGVEEMNAANISVLPVGDEIWALWEGGEPYAVAPGDLSTRGPVLLGDGLQGVPFSAHPRIGRDGTIWNFGMSSFTGQLILYELDPSGTLRRFKLLEGLPRAMVHDFMETERFLVVGFPPFLIRNNDGPYVDRFRWVGDEARVYAVIDKETLEIVRRHDLPAKFVFHHVDAIEDGDGTIRFHACAYEDTSWLEVEARAVMDGTPFSGDREAELEAVTLYPDGRAKSAMIGDAAEFPVSHPGSGDDTFWHVGRTSAGSPVSNALVARHGDGREIARWGASGDTALSEHVPVISRRGRVLLMGPQFDGARGRTLFSVFDGQAVDHGPLALWELPDAIPVPLHGAWVGVQ